MSKSRTIFYCIFAAFHLFLFFFSLYVDRHSEDYQFLITLQSKIWLLKYGSFLGLLLLGIAVLWDLRDVRAHRKEKDQLNHEINVLKAKLFDIQEEQRKTEYRPSPESPETP
ncbi:MAG: hypothetical protein LOY03_07710 [Cyclobacteriaceae bacterium]|jgi:hypothetical protein|nr:hypothetical protein [Cyclobacteriaceae bacterium]